MRSKWHANVRLFGQVFLGSFEAKERTLAMRSFAQRPTTAQETASAKFAMRRRTDLKQNRESSPILRLQRTVGNRAVRRLLDAEADQRGSRLAGDLTSDPAIELVAQAHGLARDGVAKVNAARVDRELAQGHSEKGGQATFAQGGISYALPNVVVQLNPDGVPSALEEREAVRRMEHDISMAEQLLHQDLSDNERDRIRRAIANARERLEHYQELRDRGETRAATMSGIGVAAGAIVADDATVVGTVDDPLLILLGLAAIATLIVTRPPASQDAVAEAWGQTGRAIGELASAIETIVWMTAAGNVIHDHIVEEARQLAIALGVAASAAAVTREMLCEMLRRMATQSRQMDTEKWKKIISTMKGLNCRRSRAGR